MDCVKIKNSFTLLNERVDQLSVILEDLVKAQHFLSSLSESLEHYGFINECNSVDAMNSQLDDIFAGCKDILTRDLED